MVRSPEDHVELGVACFVCAVDLREQQIARGLAADEIQVVISPRQNAVGEDKQVRADRLRPDLLSSELQNAAHLGRTGEIREGAQINLSFGLAVPSSAPRPPPSPDHGTTIALVQVMKLELGFGRRVRSHGWLLADEVGEQSAGSEVPRVAPRHAVGAGTGEQHRRLAGSIRAGQNGDGIVEGEPDVLDASQIRDTDFHQCLIALAFARTQRIPHIVEFPVDWRHVGTWR